MFHKDYTASKRLKCVMVRNLMKLCERREPGIENNCRTACVDLVSCCACEHMYVVRSGCRLCIVDERSRTSVRLKRVAVAVDYVLCLQDWERSVFQSQHGRQVNR
jgi:hypothetical protein